MLFETRESVAEVSPALVPARDAFLAGKSREAWRLANELRKTLRTAALPNDYILCMEIARACSAVKTYLALTRKAIATFPNHPTCQLYHARALLTRGLHKEGLEYLHSLESLLGHTHPGLWASALANTYADVGFAESCDKWMKHAAPHSDFDSPLGLYTRASAMESLQRWDEAIELSRRCVEVAPRWSRARTLLIHCLLTRSHVDAAIKQWESAVQSGDEDASLDLTGGMLAFSLGQFGLARDRFENFLRDWSQAEHRNWARRCLAILLVETGDHLAARAVVGDDGNTLALPEIPEAASGAPHVFIPLPLLAQNKDQCLPTTIAMAAYPQGRSLEPDQLFREMNGRDGTAIWRAWDWVKDHGFEPHAVRPEKRAAIAMLDAGIPLIGTIHGAFDSHVEVITGYNEDLGVAYVRDPGYWAPVVWPWDLLLQRYELNNGLLAVIDEGNRDAITTATLYHAPDFVALVDIGRAVAQGNTADAEAASQRIADDSPACYLRDCSGVRVTLSTKRYHDKLLHWASNPDENLVVRFRALMSLGSDDAKKMLEDMEQQNTDQNEQASLGQGAKRFLQLIVSMNDGHWQQANRLINRLLRRGCGVSSFWEMKSDIESELGNATASLESLTKAIELEPLRMILREKWLQRNIHRLTFNEYLKEFDRLLESAPDNKHLLYGRVSALLDGPDGKAFEAAAEECIGWFPRDPSAYGQLMQWYDSQGRSDLQNKTLDRAKQWMPDIFSEDDAKAAPEGEAKPGEEFTADSPLPTDKEELLALVWKLSDPRRERAMAEAVTMGREHRLAWFEYARVVACRVLLPENGADAKPAVTPSECLPLEFPGAPHWFCETVSEIVTQYNSVLEIAKAVCDWMERVVPDYEAYPALWFQRVLLLENAREKELALQELKRIIERYPANSSALYRMGVVKYQQQDYKSSLHYADASLNVNPGLLGSLQLKRRLFEIIDDPNKYAETLSLLRTKLPYDFDLMQTHVLELAKSRSLDELMHELESVEADFPAKRFAVMRARLFFDAGDFAKTMEILDCVDVSQLEAGGPDDSLLEDYFQLQLTIAEQSGNTTTTLQVCEAGLKHWPDSSRLKEIKADCIAKTNPKEAASLLHATIVDGQPSARMVWQYIETSGKPAGQACLELVGKVDESKQEELVDLCDDVLAQPSLMHLRASFLEAMLKRFPESNHLRWKLASHLHLTGDLKRAVKYATQLHDRTPQEPESSWMLGRVLIDMNPKKALPHLEAACKKNRSVEYLFDLARCHQMVGNEGQSKVLHWEILNQNPFVAASWTNLYIFGESRQKLWPLVEPIIKAGRGSDDQYFLVAAVKLAIQMNRTLPREWFQLAVVRYQMLHTYTGFRNERSELKNAIVAWMITRPGDKDGYTALPSTGFGLYARFVWPKRAWIPVT